MRKLIDLLLIALSIASLTLALSNQVSGEELAFSNPNENTVGLNMGFVESRVSQNESDISDHDKRIEKLQDRIDELESRLENKKPKAKPAKKSRRKATSAVSHSYSEPGHTHRCSRCGARWSHGNSNVGNASAHYCPSCGHLEWGNRTEGRLSSGTRSRSSRSRVIRITPSWSTGSSYNCPSGMCPSY